jgi:hypothetical protein
MTCTPLYVPGATLIQDPAPVLALLAFCSEAHGKEDVPGLLSLPDEDT